MRKHHAIVVVAFLGTCFALSWGLWGQIRDQNVPPSQITLQGMSPQDLQLLRQDIRRQKQKLIGENLPMTESEAVKFWAVYEKYSGELKEINDEKFAMLHAYSQNWRSMSNEDALIFMRRWLEVDEKVVPLRSNCLPLVRDALRAKSGDLLSTGRAHQHDDPSGICLPAATTARSQRKGTNSFARTIEGRQSFRLIATGVRGRGVHALGGRLSASARGFED